jgi:hypothetical protein
VLPVLTPARSTPATAAIAATASPPSTRASSERDRSSSPVRAPRAPRFSSASLLCLHRTVDLIVAHRRDAAPRRNERWGSCTAHRCLG